MKTMTNFINAMINMYYEHECYEYHYGRSTNCHASNSLDTR